MLFIENMYTIIIIIMIIKNVWLTTVVKKSKGLDISPPSYLRSSPLSVSPESNDHQTLLTGDPGGGRCRCYPSFAHFGRGKCG